MAPLKMPSVYILNYVSILTTMLDLIDKCIIGFDKTLRTVLPAWPTTSEIENPSLKHADIALTRLDSRQSQSMMRVNLAGEVAAQGLYRGQMIFAKDPNLKLQLEQAALEEFNHYVWCLERLKELNADPSLFNPIWYFGALSIGLFAALMSDDISLGFIIATEEQVSQHLASHLLHLPLNDLKSRAIVETMYEDELQHAENAENSGGTRLPLMAQHLMHRVAQVMIQVSRLI